MCAGKVTDASLRHTHTKCTHPTGPYIRSRSIRGVPKASKARGKKTVRTGQSITSSFVALPVHSTGSTIATCTWLLQVLNYSLLMLPAICCILFDPVKGSRKEKAASPSHTSHASIDRSSIKCCRPLPLPISRLDLDMPHLWHPHRSRFTMRDRS